jgi:hypothetical protein
MVAGAKKHPLRDARMRPDPDRRKIQDENLLADPRVTSNLKPPWQVDIHPRFDDNPLANLPAEEPEQSSFEARRPRNRGEEKHYFADIPKRLDKNRTAAVETAGGVKTIEAHSGHDIVI